MVLGTQPGAGRGVEGPEDGAVGRQALVESKPIIEDLRQFTIDVPLPADAKPALGAAPTNLTTGSMAPGAPDALCMTPGPNPVLFAGDLYPGRIYKLSLDGKVLGVLGESGKQLKQFGWIHEIACPSENTLYVGELLNWRLQKLTLHPR